MERGPWTWLSLGCPLAQVYSAKLQAGMDIHAYSNWWDKPCLSLFPIPGYPSCWGAGELSYPHCFLPSYLMVQQFLPPAGLSREVRNFLQRNKCWSPLLPPKEHNVSYLTHNLAKTFILLLSGTTRSKNVTFELWDRLVVRQFIRVVFKNNNSLLRFI